MATQVATFGAGCFWGVEETFRAVPGVKETAVGYMGGTLEKPRYEDVCTDKTGHAEVVQVIYDPDEVPYEKLLNVFWENHNPTQWNRQGPDYGSQYRSVIFYHTSEQQTEAQRALAELEASGKFDRKIVTVIEGASTFWKAEDYHQQYLAKRGLGSCHL